MPGKPNRGCTFPHCTAMATQGYSCADHSSDERRGSSTERGYDADWRRFRLWFIARHPLCLDCKIVATTDVHHILKLATHPALRLVEGNCLGLCSTCHK